MREFPASPALASAVFLHREAGEASRQNAQLSLSLGETFSVSQMRDTWEMVLAAHPQFKCGFVPATGTEVTLRETEEPAVVWQQLDWKNKERQEIPALWNGLLSEESTKPFNLENPPFLRGTIIELPGGQCHLLLIFPSFLLDDEELFVLIGQFLNALEGHAPTAVVPLKEGRAASSESLAWWAKTLEKGSATGVEIRPRSPGQAKGWISRSVLQSREESRTITEAAALLGVTPQQLFQGVAAVVFGRLGGTAEGLLLTNTSTSSQLLPARFSLKAEKTVEDFFKAFAETDNARTAHSDIALPKVLSLAKPSPTFSDFSTAFIWSPAILVDRIHDTWMRWMNVDAKLTRPLVAPLVIEVKNAVRFSIELHFDQAVYPIDEAGKLFDRYFQVLNAVIADPGTKIKDLPILLEGEGAKIPGGNGHTPSAAKRVEERFVEIAARQANDLAVQGDGETGLTFSEVRDHAQALAGYLKQENVSEGWMIGICLLPTPWVPVATIGVLLAGNTCVPLSAEATPEWLAARVQACDAEIVICDSHTAALFDGTSRRLLVIDQQWDTVAAAPASKEIAPAPKTAFLLSGTEQDAPTTLNAISPALLAAATKESLSRWRLKPGSKLPLSGGAGTGAYLENLITSLNAGSTLLLSTEREPAKLVALEPTHLRLTEAQWRSLILDLQRGVIAWPESIRSVCVETRTVSAALFAAWQTLVSEDTATHFFWSPIGSSGLGLRSFTKGREPQGEPPIGSPTQGITAKLTDGCDAELPPHYAGAAKLQLADDSAHSWILRAWRDNDGSLHLTPRHDGAEILRHQSSVLDAHLESVTVGGRLQRGAWVVLAAEITDSVETVARELSLKLPTREQPDFLFTVERFPLTIGGEILAEALPKPAELPPPAEEPKVTPTKSIPPKPQTQSPAVAVTSTAQPAVEAVIVDDEPEIQAGPWEPLLLLHKEPGTPILLLVHDIEGNPEQLRPLAKALDGEWTLYATRGHDAGALSIEDEAAIIVAALQSVDPSGPYHIFGAGFGAILAYEIAHQLRSAGLAVHYLALAGASAPLLPGSKDWLRSIGRLFGGGAKATAPLSASAQARAQARDAYRAPTLEGPVGVILGPDQGRDVENGWMACAPDAFVERINIPAPQMLGDLGAKRLAVILREWAVPSQDEEG